MYKLVDYYEAADKLFWLIAIILIFVVRKNILLRKALKAKRMLQKQRIDKINAEAEALEKLASDIGKMILPVGGMSKYQDNPDNHK